MELLEYLEDRGGEDDTSTRIDSAEFEGNDLQLGVSIWDYGETKFLSRWLITAYQVVDSNCFATCGDICLHADHVLARQHTDPRLDLYFVDRCSVPAAEIVGRLFLAHVRVTDHWIQFRKYLNCNLPLDKLLDGGSGKLAEGPRFILDAYREVLVSAGLRVSVPAQRPAKRWDGTAWVENPSSLSTLVIGERAFVVAASFESIQRAVLS